MRICVANTVRKRGAKRALSKNRYDHIITAVTKVTEKVKKVKVRVIANIDRRLIEKLTEILHKN